MIYGYILTSFRIPKKNGAEGAYRRPRTPHRCSNAGLCAAAAAPCMNQLRRGQNSVTALLRRIPRQGCTSHPSRGRKGERRSPTPRWTDPRPHSTEPRRSTIVQRVARNPSLPLRLYRNHKVLFPQKKPNFPCFLSPFFCSHRPPQHPFIGTLSTNSERSHTRDRRNASDDSEGDGESHAGVSSDSPFSRGHRPAQSGHDRIHGFRGLRLLLHRAS